MYAQHIMGQVITRGGHTHTHTHTHTHHTHTHTQWYTHSPSHTKHFLIALNLIQCLHDVIFTKACKLLSNICRCKQRTNYTIYSSSPHPCYIPIYTNGKFGPAGLSEVPQTWHHVFWIPLCLNNHWLATLLQLKASTSKSLYPCRHPLHTANKESINILVVTTVFICIKGYVTKYKSWDVHVYKNSKLSLVIQ